MTNIADGMPGSTVLVLSAEDGIVLRLDITYDMYGIETAGIAQHGYRRGSGSDGLLYNENGWTGLL